MKYGSVPGIEKPVSRIAQGCMMLATGDGQEKSNQILDAAVDAGINTFDLAWVYGGGDCERSFGNWLENRDRESVVILDKGSHHNKDRKKVTPFDIEADLHDSLARLKTSYIDLWMFHRDDPDQPVGPLVETLNAYLDRGIIRAFGGSNWTKQRIEAANDYAEKHNLVGFAASSPNFSLAEQIDSPWGPDCVTISGPKSRDVRKWYAQSRMPVFTWSSLARGFFSGRISRRSFQQVADQFEEHVIRCYVSEDNWRRLDRVETIAQERGLSIPQVALAYVLHQPMNVFALVGARSPEEIAANQVALETELSGEEVEWLDLLRDER